LAPGGPISKVKAWLSNLRLRFLLLVLLAVLPAVVLLLLTVSEQRDEAVKKGQANAQQLAGLATADQGRLIESTRQLLTLLALLPEVQEGGTACNELFASLLKQFPLYANLGVIGADGMVTCSGIPISEPINLGDRTYFQHAVESKSFVVGEYQTGRITGKPALNCGYPVIDANGNVTEVVYAAIDLNSIAQQFASEAQLPDGAILTVLDRTGHVLARVPEQPELIGASLVGTPVVDEILAQGSGRTEESLDGTTYVIAYQSLGSSDQVSAYLSVALPKGDITASAEKQFGDNLTRLALAVMVIVIAAWVGTDLLVRQSPEIYKSVVRRYYDAFSTGGTDLLDDVVADDFVDHDPMPGQPPGLVGIKLAVDSFRAAFPDGEMVVDSLIAEGDRVVARVTMSGTHRGEYAGMPGTGKAVRAEGMEIFRLADGKLAEGWSRFVLPLAMIERDSSSQIPEDGDERADIDLDGAVRKSTGPVRSLIRSAGRLIGLGGQ
jgi:steroid delta-isomerase-like uncharacterized protein